MTSHFPKILASYGVKNTLDPQNADVICSGVAKGGRGGGRPPPQSQKKHYLKKAKSVEKFGGGGGGGTRYNPRN